MILQSILEFALLVIGFIIGFLLFELIKVIIRIIRYKSKRK